jgi:hypothetical protein
LLLSYLRTITVNEQDQFRVTGSHSPMLGAAIESRVSLRAALLAALLAAAWLVPASVQASCGDYLTMLQHSDSPVHFAASETSPGTPPNSLPQTQVKNAAPSELPLRHPCERCPRNPGRPGNIPCQGPSCSGNSNPVTLPTTTAETPRDRAICTTPRWLGEPEAIPCALLREHAHRVHHAFPIYHPPRSA